MPVKSVHQYECDRCNRTWYENSERKVAYLKILMTTSKEKDKAIDSEYQILCETCENAVVNYVKAIVKKAQKKGPKSKAKEEGAEAPTSTDDDDVLVLAPTVG